MKNQLTGLNYFTYYSNDRGRIWQQTTCHQLINNRRVHSQTNHFCALRKSHAIHPVVHRNKQIWDGIVLETAFFGFWFCPLCSLLVLRTLELIYCALKNSHDELRRGAQVKRESELRVDLGGLLRRNIVDHLRV